MKFSSDEIATLELFLDILEGSFLIAPAEEQLQEPEEDEWDQCA